MSKLSLVVEIGNALQRRMGSTIEHIGGISLAEFWLLDAIADAPEGEISRVALSGAVNMTPSGVSRALKPLEKIGVVESIRSERDARQTKARLTDAGREVYANCSRALEEAMSDLPDFPLEREALEAYWTELMTPRPRELKYKTNGAFLQG